MEMMRKRKDKKLKHMTVGTWTEQESERVEVERSVISWSGGAYHEAGP
jgi:hypothetical protein